MTKHIFSQILDRKRKAVARLRADPASRDFGDRALEIRKNAQPHRFLRALESDPQRLIIIAEFKRRSPSVGIIRDDLTVREIVRCYERGGACRNLRSNRRRILRRFDWRSLRSSIRHEAAAVAQRFHHRSNSNFRGGHCRSRRRVVDCGRTGRRLVRPTAYTCRGRTGARCARRSA